MNAYPQPLTIATLSQAYRDGLADPRLVVEALCREIRDPRYAPLWTCWADEATLWTRSSWLSKQLRAKGAAVFEEMPLFGMPCAVKDNIDIAGLPTTAACPEFAYVPDRSAEVVTRLEQAGAIVLGKTNLDQFATGLTGTRSPLGTVTNPFDPRYISGGSSSGSAAAVALGLLAFSIGTDTAGSGRVPAGFCNLVGIKPTPGLVSTSGVFPACRSLDCVSVFAATVADGWQVLQALAGPDPRDAYSRWVPPLELCTRSVRLGVPDNLDFCGDTQAQAAFAETLQTISGLPNLSLVPVNFTPFQETAALLYEGPWVAERRGALGAFFTTHAEALEPSVRTVIARGDDISAAQAFRGLHQLEALRRRAADAFQAIDVLVVPTAPAHFSLEQIAAAPIERNNDLGRYTNFVNLLGMSALALPGLFRTDGLPAGITLLAPGGGDHRLAEFARILEPLIHQRLGTSTEQPPRRRVALEPLPFSEATVKVAVVGAHLSGQPLNWQLAERGGRLLRSTRTAAAYRLYALPGTTPPKPGLARVAAGGSAIALEVWELPLRRYGDFVAAIPPPLGIGTLELEDGESVQGFLCEPWALEQAQDISHYGGWLAYLADHGRGVRQPA